MLYEVITVVGQGDPHAVVLGDRVALGRDARHGAGKLAHREGIRLDQHGLARAHQRDILLVDLGDDQQRAFLADLAGVELRGSGSLVTFINDLGGRGVGMPMSDTPEVV